MLYSLFFFWALKFPYEAWSIKLKFITIYFYIYVSLAYIFSFRVAHLILIFLSFHTLSKILKNSHSESNQASGIVVQF